MSKAGVLSNRGDHYQILVAMDWAISILTNEQYDYLEVDSTALDATGQPIAVDDVVIGCKNGGLIACQCKKNQTDFEVWSISDLTDEIKKSAQFLTANPISEARFYSRNDFGAVAALREYALNQPNETAYTSNLPKKRQKDNESLTKNLTGISNYQWLTRTHFETTEDFDRLQDNIMERLATHVSSAKAAFNALWVALDNLGSRTSNSNQVQSIHRLNKADLQRILAEAGCQFAPPKNQQQLEQVFASISAVGRHWRRDIAGHRLAVPTVNELQKAILNQDRSVLLSGAPGAGKTCVLLALQEQLEPRRDLATLFIQAREYAHCATADDRAALGLPADLTGLVGRMADIKPVVVIIDSLDVLSLSREHNSLGFFLAQIDRLLRIANVSVIAACREFDRKYDRRLAERQWDLIVNNTHLDWETQVLPLLQEWQINPDAIDKVTGELIQNPRELALFAEVAQRCGSFNALTSQALGRRYLQAVVQNDAALGDIAMQALEQMANTMLQTRQLHVPRVKIPAADTIVAHLLSAQVLHQNQAGHIEFGHQTLLDVLVVSYAQRQNLSLFEFIAQLPAVPFVRPTIRAFVADLLAGPRKTLRAQLRAVFDSNAAFHLKRLLAESFATLHPEADDWPLIKHLHQQQRGVFQSLYIQARDLAWHTFWLQYLVPYLVQQQDAESVYRHISLVELWKNDAPDSVVDFWLSVLNLTWLDQEHVALNVILALQKFDFSAGSKSSEIVQLLLATPRRDHDLLGCVIAKAVEAEVLDDAVLWQYITGDITAADITEYHLNNKLHCDLHEFEDEDFLSKRMLKSELLLDLAIAAIEKWSRVNSEGFECDWYEHFLHCTSYEFTHSQHDFHPGSNEQILIYAIEKAILHHAKLQTDWWIEHRFALSRSHEGAFRYIAILALNNHPEANLAEISLLVTDGDMLKSNLSYELGRLLNCAFPLLMDAVQDAVFIEILGLWRDKDLGENQWIIQERVKLLSAIPAYQRTHEAQIVIDEYWNKFGNCDCSPRIHSRGGMVGAPFSYEKFIEFSDQGVLKLLAHYAIDPARGWHDDFLIGGSEQVEWQLREAASRTPTRFIRLLCQYWQSIPRRYKQPILEGAANYIEYRFGNTRSNDQWQAIELANPQELAALLLDEIERHSPFWYQSRATANCLQACAHVIEAESEAERLIFTAVGFATLHEKEYDGNLIGRGINMTRGAVVEALMILATRWAEYQLPLPDTLVSLLRRYARDPQLPMRALILRRLPALHHYQNELGWQLLDLTLAEPNDELWSIAELYLYYTYHQQFDQVAPILDRIYQTASGETLQAWGRISALAVFAGHIEFNVFSKQLTRLSDVNAWRGAAQVWTHPENYQKHYELCLSGIRDGLQQIPEFALVTAKSLHSLFRKGNQLCSIPFDIIDQHFSVIEQDQKQGHGHFYGFDEWLLQLSFVDLDEALAIAERFAAYASKTPYALHQHQATTQLLTRLFGEAEERELADQGVMLNRVIALQDVFLTLLPQGLETWLKDAERP